VTRRWKEQEGLWWWSAIKMMKIPGKLQWAWFLNLAIWGNTTINWKMAARNSSVTIKMTTTTTVCCFRWGPPPPGTWWFPVNDTILMYRVTQHSHLKGRVPRTSDLFPVKGPVNAALQIEGFEFNLPFRINPQIELPALVTLRTGTERKKFFLPTHHIFLHELRKIRPVLHNYWENDWLSKRVEG
jgi:hypothetical protein